MRNEGVVRDYAIGSATAVLFYAEPTRTYDVDVFALLPSGDQSVRVVDPEHLIALALQAGGARRRERAWLLLQAGVADRLRLRTVLDAHGIRLEIPDEA